MLQSRKLVDYIRENKIQLVHCHLPWAGFVVRFIFKRTGIPVIYTEHNKQERYHWVTRYINKFTFNRQTKVIAVSNDVAESIEKNIHPKIEVQTILNGVDTRHFKRNIEAGNKLRQSLAVPEGTIVLGTIAVFRFQKRLKEWVDLFKILLEKYPNIVGCIVGDGPLKEEIKLHIRQSGLEEKIIMPGLQTDVLPWLSAMDIFVMTSEFEGLPIALLEAMSMECAVVCTNAGGIRELIRDKEDGFLAPVENWKELEKPLSHLITDPAEIAKWGARARQRIETAFSMQTMVQQTEKLYLSLL
jgi:glycosyltransferase involved in cell wall biosynthesis